MTVLESPQEMLRALQPIEVQGTVTAVRGLTVLVADLPLPIGAVVRFTHARNAATSATTARGEVVGFDDNLSIVMLFNHASGIAPGMRVIGEQAAQTVAVSIHHLGRVMNGLGEPIDNEPMPLDTYARPLHAAPTSPLGRGLIREPLATGVRAMDGFLTVGRGQRLGIFSAAGVGKSTLLGTIARNTSADVNVIALIGERGREVREFIQESLGPEGLARSVVVVATGDESPLLRVRAAYVACTVAEFFRDTGKDVMLMMDSVTRFAQAQRQIGLAVGEHPATRGYTPSVFAQLPVLLERAGAIEGGGSITGFYAVLVEGDDLDEPISDAARGVLDGHVVLSRKLASRAHYPAIDVTESISRVANDVCDPHHQAARAQLVRLLAAYRESEELINIGAYVQGTNQECDIAITIKPHLDSFLQQQRGEPAAFPETCRTMIELSGLAEQLAAQVKRNSRSIPAPPA